MKDIWNARHPDGKIIADRPYEIWMALGENMKNTCNRESCWMKQKWSKNKLSKDTKKSFAPTKISYPKEIPLNNEVIKQFKVIAKKVRPKSSELKRNRRSRSAIMSWL